MSERQSARRALATRIARGRCWPGLGLGVVITVGGLLSVTVLQAAGPVASAPLYDGVVVQDPYRYLAPSSGQDGNPTSASATVAVESGTSPAFSAATSESPPQAQLIAPAGAFTVTSDAASLSVGIVPMIPAVQDGVVSNDYRITVSDDRGSPVPMAGAAQITVVLRVPDGAADARIARYLDGTWQDLPTDAGGLPGIDTTNTSSLGEFAIVGTATPGSTSSDRPILVAGLVIVIGVIIALLFVGRGRDRRPAQPAHNAPRSTRPPGRKRHRGRPD